MSHRKRMDQRSCIEGSSCSPDLAKGRLSFLGRMTIVQEKLVAHSNTFLQTFALYTHLSLTCSSKHRSNRNVSSIREVSRHQNLQADMTRPRPYRKSQYKPRSLGSSSSTISSLGMLGYRLNKAYAKPPVKSYCNQFTQGRIRALRRLVSL